MSLGAAFRDLHWPALKGRFYLLLGTVTLFAAVLIWLHLDAAAVRSAVGESEARLREVRDAYFREEESVRLAKTYRERYQKVEQTGLLKPLDRIALLELIERYRKEEAIPTLTLRFEPEKALDGYRGVRPERHRLHASLQHLEFALRDELELDRLLRLLAGAGEGVFVVEDCRLSRRDRVLHLDAPGNVSGRCSLRWLNLSPEEVHDG